MSSTAWKGRLTLGDLAIAVLFTHGPKASESRMKQIHDSCGEPVGGKHYCKGSHGTIKSTAIGKAAEFHGRLVPIPAAGLDAIAPNKSSTLPLETRLKTARLKFGVTAEQLLDLKLDQMKERLKDVKTPSER